MNLRAPLLLVLCAPFASACFQKLDDSASRDFDPNAAVEAPDGGGSGAPFPVNLTTPEIGKTAADNGDVTATSPTACDKVTSDAHDIRQRVCSGCHEGAGAQGAPLTFILEDNMIINGKSTSAANAGKTYIVPGDPDNSLIYRRAAIIQDMPPGSTDVRNAATSLSISDFSILRDWILMCTGGASQTSGAVTTGAGGGSGTTTSGAAGASGTTGTAGTSGAAGAGGASGSDAGGTSGTTTGAGGAGGSGVARDNTRFNFEAGRQGWAAVTGTGLGTFTNVATSGAQIFAGTRALAGTIASTAAADYFLEVQNPTALTAGATVTFHVFIPTTGLDFVQPYVVDAANVFTGSFFMNPTTGAWATLTVVIPANAGAITRLGVQFHTATATFNGTVYVDSVDY